MKDIAAALAELLRTLPASADIGGSQVVNRNRSELMDRATLLPGQTPEESRAPAPTPRSYPRGERPVTIAAGAPEAGRSLRERPARKARGRRANRAGSGAWMAGLVGLAMVGAVVCVVAVVLHAGNQKQGSSTPIARKDAGERSVEPLDGTDGSDKEKIRNDVREIPDRFTNRIDMKLVRIPGTREIYKPKNTFTMGSPRSEWIVWGEQLGKGEYQHEVEVSPFHLGVYEVTQRQFRKVMKYNPSYFSTNAKGRAGANYPVQPGAGRGSIPPGENTEDYPVEMVSWDEAKEFCEKLTTMDTVKPRGWIYRLPTEAEWEYACRGGSAVYQVFHFGNTLSSKQANFQGSIPYPPVNDARPGGVKGPNLQRTCRVGTYNPNGFGLYDMHGNVFEWCQDWWEEDYYQHSAPKDPTGPAMGTVKVQRGGGWLLNGFDCRSAWRPLGHQPELRAHSTGFRVALVLSGR
jgi:formylglycine-generating enzyme required for sulfatase activity